MAGYIHHVPGRLRVKSPSLKGNETQALRTREYMQTLLGVHSVAASTVTGSIVIKYDAASLGSATLLDSLHGIGVLHRPVDPHAPAYPNNDGATLGRTLASKVLNKAVETLVERSAVALIATLI